MEKVSADVGEEVDVVFGLLEGLMFELLFNFGFGEGRFFFFFRVVQVGGVADEQGK